MDNCSYCSVASDSLLKCVCGVKSYCDRKCQKNDWKTHKKECPPFVIRPIGEKGKGLIATRNISRGTLVLEEIPTLGLKEVDAGKIAEEFHKLPRTKQDEILNVLDPDNDDDAIIKRINRILDNKATTAGVESILPGMTEPTTYNMKLIYLKVCFVNHSCNPNCFQRSQFGTYRHSLYTIVDVKKGDELTRNYVAGMEDCNPGNVGLSCEMRQMKIDRMFGFKCSCSECLIGDKNDSIRKQYHDLLFEFDRAKLEVPEALTNFVKMFNFQMKYMTIAEKKLEIGRKIQPEAYMQDLLHVLKSLWGLCCLEMTEENREEARQNCIVLDPSVHVKFKNYKKEFESMLTFLPEWRQTYLQTFDYRKAKDPNFMKGFEGSSCSETVTAADTSGEKCWWFSEESIQHNERGT